jgi:uncharacterized protein (TIGR03067 family)
MRRLAPIPLSLLLLLPLGAARADDASKEQEKLQGRWTATQFVANGREVPQDEGKAITFAFDGEKIRMEGPGGVGQREYTFKLDPAKKPKGIDMTIVDGPYKGDVVPGIYELDGDTLTLCLPNKPMTGRPAEFKSAQGSQLALFHLKRIKK